MVVVADLTIIVVLETPFVIVIWNLIKFSKESPTGSTFMLVVACFCTGIWTLADIPMVILAPEITNEFRESFLHISLVLLAFGQITLVSYYVNASWSRRTAQLSRITLVALCVQMGVLIAGLVCGSCDTIVIIENEECFHRFFSAEYVITLGVSSVLFAALLASFYDDYRRLGSSVASDSEKRLNGRAVLLILSGTAIGTFFFILESLVHDSLRLFFGIMFIITRIPISLGVLLLALHVARSPVFLLHTKGNARHLVTTGVVGWGFAAMRDAGPDVVSHNDLFNKRNNITDLDMLAFCTTSLMAVGMGESFTETSFIVPFGNLDALVSLCLSFYHPDPGLTDPRFKGNALCIFSIIIPTALLVGVGNLSTAHAVLSEYKERAQTVNDLAEEEMAVELTQLVLDTII